MGVPSQVKSCIAAAIVFVAYGAVRATGLVEGGDYLHRGFSTEFAYFFVGSKYDASLDCAGTPRYRVRTLRGDDRAEAEAYLAATLPDCGIVDLRYLRWGT